MPLLRLTQSAEGQPDNYRVEIVLEGKDGDGKEIPRQAANVSFPFTFKREDQADLRWYLEDYLQYPFDPSPVIAARVEERMKAIGQELFDHVFGSRGAFKLWARLSPTLNDTRVEIVIDVRGAAAIPWELIRDPDADAPLALAGREFTRALPESVQPPKIPLTASGPIRILLVICRPRAGEDVPFRSTASRILKGLTAEARAAFQLDVLRPPTFEQLGKTLRAAKARGEPYHIVHFDGHGTYLETGQEKLADLLKRLGAIMLSGPREGRHGYLLFENPQADENAELVDGSSLGKLLVETDVPVLVLNACRSAHADTEETSNSQNPNPNRQSEISNQRSDDPHSAVRAFGSLAQEVMDAGVAGVVAMRYNVYVVTAAQFVADLYAALVQGQSLGEAVSLGRKQLAAQPMREIASDPRPLQDWPVPVVYEAAPIALFPKGRPQGSPLQITITDHATRTTSPGLPPPPDVGFFGRDETLLALDRAFDTQHIVLLHAYAGSGKSSTAAEFARWYALTGGLEREGQVLFTSFETYNPLPRVLDKIEQVFGPRLERAGVNWLALSDNQRRDVALQVLKQIPVLWIWDNVEPVAGFPASKQSAWKPEEQKELKEFLSAVRETQARFLLTSRRDERGWLGDLPARFTLPPMHMQERVLLARALAEKHGRRLTEVEDWRPLLAFTQGNPLTITVLVGQALRDGLKTKAQIYDFVNKLRKGEAAFEDEASEGRSKSLGASLSYGFASAFTEEERKILALLHFFQGFVDVDALRWMGDPEIGNLPEVHGLTPETSIALLNRAAEIGLLTAHGGGYYSIHPALPWYFKNLFDTYYPASSTDNPPSATRSGRQLSATRALVEALGMLSNYYKKQYESGNRDVITLLAAEEANLLYAQQLAHTNSWWDALISTMQGLNSLYSHTGRRTGWARLVDEIVPDFVDTATDGPLPGREEHWSFVIEYRWRLAMEARKWAEAERLVLLRMDWNRRHATSALAVWTDSLDEEQQHVIRMLAVSAEYLGHIQAKQHKPECITAYEEAIKLYQRIGDHTAEAVVALNFGHAYTYTLALRDLVQAEHWCRRSLELRDERDQLGRGRCLNSLGNIAFERFQEAQAADRLEAELREHINAALNYCQQALALLPPDAVDDLAVTHNQLGNIYSVAGDLDRALPHYRESIRCKEAAGNLYGAGTTRFNVAATLMRAGRLDAREYAYAALRNFETCGEGAAAEIQRTRGLIDEIEKALGD